MTDSLPGITRKSFFGTDGHAGPCGTGTIRGMKMHKRGAVLHVNGLTLAIKLR